MIAVTRDRESAATRAGSTELTEDQLTEGSGGPTAVELPAVQSAVTGITQTVRVPIGSVRAAKG